MSDPEKPLHVRVAEKMGCQPKPGSLISLAEWECGCLGQGKFGRLPHAIHTIHDECCHSSSGLSCDRWGLARYDLDWSATGPLVERLGIGIARMRPGSWFAHVPEQGDEQGATPLLAICNLILALPDKVVRG